MGSSGPLQVITEIASAEKAHWQLNRTAIDKVANKQAVIDLEQAAGQT